MPRYELYEIVTEGDHTFACYDVMDDPDLVEDVAAMVRDMYLEPAELVASLREAAAGLDAVADEGELGTLLQHIADAVVPLMNTDAKVPHLEVVRNEVAEILAVDVMEKIHGAVVPAVRVKHKEVSQLPSRGLDVLALHNPICVVLCEVKASSAAPSPPPVVGSGHESMRRETLRRLRNNKSIIAELNWAHKHAKPEHRLTVAKALLLHAKQAPPTPHVAPVLVRPAGAYKTTDFGCFRKTPTEYAPSPVRFVVLRLPYTLEQFADEVYTRARSGAA